MKNAISANWVAENGVATATGFNLKGSSKGYASFMKAFTAGDQVFYSAHDDRGNREAGYATFNGSNLVNRHATATLYNGVYQHQSPPKINFSGEITIACTFNAVAFNVLWKALDAIDPDGDGNINIPPELIDGLVVALDSKAEQADLEAEIAARIAGDKALQDQIDAIDPDGNRAVSWDEVEGKPSAFPPATHNHDGDYIKDETDPTVPDHVKGITQTDIDNWNAGGGGGASTWDELTGKPTEFPPEAHTHGQDEVDGLELRLEAIEDSITSGGGFVDAPDDGKLYGRQSEAWAEVVIPSTAWDDITSKPTEFAPEAHVHAIADVTDLQGALDDKADAVHTHEIADVNGLQDALDNAGGPPVYVDENAPENPSKGDLWYDTNSGALNLFDGSGWVVIGSGGGNVVLLLPVASRSGGVQLPLNQGGDAVPVMLRSGVSELPLNDTRNKFTVNTRSGDLDLPLMVA